MPMTRNREVLEAGWRQCGGPLALELDKGLQVAFLTLGDPSIYATAMYIHRADPAGYSTAMVPGVPSFCAAAAALNRPLCEGNRPCTSSPARAKRPERLWTGLAAKC
jgi:precorrin-2/cobalt-factor-2 C20-methyltransferase